MIKIRFKEDVFDLFEPYNLTINLKHIIDKIRYMRLNTLWREHLKKPIRINKDRRSIRIILAI